MRIQQVLRLKKDFDALVKTYSAGYLFTDPLWFVHQYEKPEDREVAAFLASAVAYGNVRQIFGTLRKFFDLLGESPAETIRRYDSDRDSRRFDGFYHRLHASKDFQILIYLLSRLLREYGSLGASFQKHYSQEDSDVGPALTGWTQEILGMDVAPFHPSRRLPMRAPVRFFFSSPAAGSCCKRLNMFLRWMVRGPDGLDLGLWGFVPPSKLVIPLDTHIFRIARALHLTRRRTANWKTAREITDHLKILDPEDPVRYDFALTRPGILKLLPSRKTRFSLSHLFKEPTLLSGYDPSLPRRPHKESHPALRAGK